MRKTYTSKPTRKRNTYTFGTIFWNFFISKNKILSDAQLKEYNTKIPTTPNTYDEPQHATNASPTAPNYQIYIIITHYH